MIAGPLPFNLRLKLARSCRHVADSQNLDKLVVWSLFTNVFTVSNTYLTPFMMSDSGSGVEPSPVQNITAHYTKIHRSYQQVLDRWTPFVLHRWLATAGLLSVFLLRIVLAQGVGLPFTKMILILTLLTVVYWFVFLIFFRGNS